MLNLNLWLSFLTQMSGLKRNSQGEVREGNGGDEDANKRMIIRESI